MTDFAPEFYKLLDASIKTWNNSRNKNDLISECVVRCLEVYQQNGWSLNNTDYLGYAKTIIHNQIKFTDYSLRAGNLSYGYQKYVLIKRIKEQLDQKVSDEQIRINLRLTEGRFKKLKLLAESEIPTTISINKMDIPVESTANHTDYEDSLSPTEKRIANLILARHTRQEIRNMTGIGYRKLNRIYRRIGRKIKKDMGRD